MSNPLYTHLRRLWLRYRPRHGRYFDYAAEKDIYYCYRLLLHREPDPAGLQMLRTQVLDQGITIQDRDCRIVRINKAAAEWGALPPEQVIGPLALLELAGLVENREGRWRLRRSNK